MISSATSPSVQEQHNGNQLISRSDSTSYREVTTTMNSINVHSGKISAVPERKTSVCRSLQSIKLNDQNLHGSGMLSSSPNTTPIISSENTRRPPPILPSMYHPQNSGLQQSNAVTTAPSSVQQPPSTVNTVSSAASTPKFTGIYASLPKVVPKLLISPIDKTNNNVKLSNNHQPTVHQSSIENETPNMNSNSKQDSHTATAAAQRELTNQERYRCKKVDDTGLKVSSNKVSAEELPTERVTKTTEFSQTKITTQPSSLTSATPDPSKTKTMKRKVTSRLDGLKTLVATLEKLVEAEFVDLAAYDSVVQQSKLILHDVTHNLHTARELINAREEQLEDANKRIRLLMAEDLSDCTSENLEDISDILWTGLQAATLALSRRQNKDGTPKDSESPAPSQEKPMQFVASNIPEAKFVSIPAPVSKTSGMKAEDLCYQLITVLEEIREIQQKKTYEFVSLQSTLKDIQTQIENTNNEYNNERTNLLLLEKKLDTRLRQVNRLTGRDTYETLTLSQLADLCKTINKASRRLTTEQAIREVRAQQGMEKDDSRCFVCFERPWDCRLEPCYHTLCSECASRLRFCPHCRQDIEEKVKLDANEIEELSVGSN